MSKNEFILSTYFKIDYLLDNEKAHFKKDQKLIFSFKNSNFIAGPTVRYVNSSEDRLKYYYSIEGWKDYFRIKGFFTKDVMLFLKYYFGIPFFFTEELNIVWDSFAKGKAFSYSSIYLDLEKDKLNDPSFKVDPRVFYYSFSLFDLLEENSVPVEIIYHEGECSTELKTT